MLVKLSEFLVFSIVGYEPQIIDLMQQMLDNQNKGSKMRQKAVSRNVS